MRNFPGGKNGKQPALLQPGDGLLHSFAVGACGALTSVGIHINAERAGLGHGREQMIRDHLNVRTHGQKQRRKDRALNQSKWMIRHRHYRALLGNQREVARGNLRVYVQLRQRMIRDEPVVGAWNVIPEAVELVQTKQFFDRAFHRRGQLLPEERG